MKWSFGARMALVAGILSVIATYSRDTASAQSVTPLASVALKTSDVPAGFKQTTGRYDVIQRVALNDKVTVAVLESKGWLASYDSTFDHNGARATTQINSGLDEFKSAGGARWDISNALHLLTKNLPHARAVSIAGIGDQAMLFKSSGVVHRARYSLAYVVFRRGPYLGGTAIIVTGSGPAPSTADVERYAHILDGRLKQS
jgi:hypothetical protein